MQDINPEILSFLSEGPQDGIVSLRRGLSYMLGTVDSDILDVCCKDVAISDELLQESGYNRPHHIFIYYNYLNKTDGDVVQFLRHRLNQARSVHSLAATLQCFSQFILESGDRDLAAFLIVYCLTRLSSPHLRQLLSNEPLAVYLADEHGLRCAVLARAMEISLASQCLIIDIDTIYSTAVAALRGSISAKFKVPSKAHAQRRISLPLKQLEAFLPDSDKSGYMEIFRRVGKKAKKLAIDLQGDAKVTFFT